jgi:methionyl-tRNA synthetase
MCAEKGDIFLDTYEGWYNEREECFVTEMDAEAANYLDAGNGLPLKKVSEESYFFRMSKYHEQLVSYIEANPTFIQPEQFRNNVLARLRKDPLRDLSISRTTFSWGIPVPEGFSPSHVMYVWFDALSNYLSGIHALDPEHELSSYWPPKHQVVGKDIIWFHCVIWPCMLFSAGISLPQSVVTHGFVNAADGRKMSKSYENTVDPMALLQTYSPDSLRYYFIASTTYGADLNFSDASLATMHNSELADTLGNLIHRGINLCVKWCDGGVIPDVEHDPTFPLPFDVVALDAAVRRDLESSCLNHAIFKTMEAVRATNRFLTEAEPWKLKGADEARRIQIVRTTLEAIYAFTHFLAPVIPYAAQSIFEKLNTPPIPTNQLRGDMYNLTPGNRVSLGDILFVKIVDEAEEAAAAAAAAGDAAAPKAKKAPVAKKVELNPDQSNFTKIELRVGRITRVWNHESAERLYCEEVDIGAAEPRQVASGLRDVYSLEEMKDRLVIVVCNLKEAKMKGFVSQGMVLAAKSADGRVQLVEAPAGSKEGDLIECAGVERDGPAWPASTVKNKKIWEAMSADLHTNEKGEACWGECVLVTSAGACRAATITNSPIS